MIQMAKTRNPKSQILNSKQITMSQNLNYKRQGYDLEDRTYRFAKEVRDFIKKLPRTIGNIEYGKQLIRASGSVGANYIEANEALSKKDFLFRTKIAKKEAKESRFWLMLVEPNQRERKEVESLIVEVTELMKILGKILENSQKDGKFGKL